MKTSSKEEPVAVKRIVEMKIIEEQDRTTYVGETVNGVYEGNGTLTYPSGDKYAGQFRGGVLVGQSLTLEGQFVGGKQDGVGRQEEGGRVYKGEYM
uniref:MORN repeat-containing protein 5 n=1 Tax=Chromera velia CCMP2878 TaxID=1169474 RepID=A0A0G4GY49_9ALVE|eukprot:Cvel_23864.t1-p1 / transcript=Cvel_23864.t1 / gene=Cvel_23864 / organism=Chromera_velia_CCMP2878 / gene_product=MORN repeat-containing protein 4, putative / transcript_product=MORN repeat-containing protein 4, putative / location=Cvel_scaffold2511:18172-24080(-) / protein_length=95 / sequence_SO=supercontig / SO=protein_coding / is_pseudo=false